MDPTHEMNINENLLISDTDDYNEKIIAAVDQLEENIDNKESHNSETQEENLAEDNFVESKEYENKDENNEGDDDAVENDERFTDPGNVNEVFDDHHDISEGNVVIENTTGEMITEEENLITKQDPQSNNAVIIERVEVVTEGDNVVEIVLETIHAAGETNVDTKNNVDILAEDNLDEIEQEKVEVAELNEDKVEAVEDIDENRLEGVQEVEKQLNEEIVIVERITEQVELEQSEEVEQNIKESVDECQEEKVEAIEEIVVAEEQVLVNEVTEEKDIEEIKVEPVEQNNPQIVNEVSEVPEMVVEEVKEMVVEEVKEIVVEEVKEIVVEEVKEIVVEEVKEIVVEEVKIEQTEQLLQEEKEIILESEVAIESENTNVEVNQESETEIKQNFENLNNTEKILDNSEASKVQSEVPLIEKEVTSENEKNVKSSPHEKTLQDLLERMIALKKDGNKNINSVSKSTEEFYRKGIEEYESFSQNFNIKTLQGEDEIKLWSKIEEERKLIFSNLALYFDKSGLYEEAMNIDFLIITQIDKLWDKSYIRIIKSFVRKGELEMASIYEQMFDKMFDETTKKRHEEHLLALKIKLEEGREKMAKKESENKLNNSGSSRPEESLNKETADKLNEKKVEVEKLNASNASQGSTIIENPEKKDDDAEKQLIKPSKKSHWIKAVFGSMFFVGCATGFYFLMRYRNKFR